MAATVRIGTSGWRYPPWRGVFYPKGLVQREELSYAASRFTSLEVNGTFYSQPRPGWFSRWYEQVPEDFLFALKGPRYVTHIKKLREPRQPLANFFASGVLLLKQKLGPILWQLPPQLGFDQGRLEAFLDLLPRSTAAAARLAREHDAAMGEHVHPQAEHQAPLRYALEVRHASFATPALVDLLRRQEVALVVAETAGRWLLAEDVTADFLYLRLHGAERLYASGYREDQLQAWAQRIRAWRAGGEPPDARRLSDQPPPSAAGRDVYAYFDNTDVELRAPFDALRLMELLEVAKAGSR